MSKPVIKATDLMATLNADQQPTAPAEMDLSTVTRGDVLECVRSSTSHFTVGRKYFVARDGQKHMIVSDNFSLIDANPRSGAKSGFIHTGRNAFKS